MLGVGVGVMRVRSRRKGMVHGPAAQHSLRRDDPRTVPASAGGARGIMHQGFKERICSEDMAKI